MELLLLLLLWKMMGVSSLLKIEYVNVALNWADAQAYCRLYFTDLVTITTEEDNDQINRDTWLGLYRDNANSSWKWSRDDEPLKFNNTWRHGEYPAFGKDCVYKHYGDGGSWRRNACSDLKTFFCAVENLFLVRLMRTWEEALAHCRSMSSSGRSYDLASLITAEDHDSVRSQITGKVWTGLRFLGDSWVWVGGEQVQYGGMTKCPENQRCGMLDKSSTQNYSINTCEERHHFFCYWKPTAA